MFKKDKMHSARGQKRKKVHGGGTFSAKNLGFSLVELIVVIAILVVFAAVLIPSLLQYTENSRAQKDESAMDEVVNAVQLALADQDCFDEMLQYSCTNNFVTYSDSTGDYASQVVDGEFWAPDGAGRATTITFNPETGYNNSTVYKMDTAIINDMTYGNGSVAHDRVMEGALINNNQCYLKNASLNGNQTGYTYNRVRQTIGDSVVSTSQTYRNSSFTVFIRFTQKDGVTVADVHGQFNGTNLYEGAPASIGTGTTEYEPETGAPIVSVTNPGTTKSEYTSSDLGGGGALGGSVNITNKLENYKQPTYVENLQKENKCEYYSSIALAVQDINNGTPGTNGDSVKNDAIACVYVDADGTSCIIVLKSCTETESSELHVKTNIILGGKQITYSGNAIKGIYMQEGGNVDGRIAGSKIVNACVLSTSNEDYVSCIDARKDCVVMGGEYEVSNGIYTYAICMYGKHNLTVKDAKINVLNTYSSAHKYNVGVGIFYNGGVGDTPNCLTVDNCDIFCKSTNGKSMGMRCINLLGRAHIKNTRGKAYADSWSDGSSAYGADAIYIGYGHNTIIDNCDFYSVSHGMSLMYGASVTVRNSKLSGSDFGLYTYGNDINVKLTNCDIIAAQKPNNYTTYSTQYGYQNRGSNAILHNCSIAGQIYISENGKTYVSMVNLNSPKQILLSSNGRLYLGTRNNFDKTKCNNQSLVEETGLMYDNFNP